MFDGGPRQVLAAGDLAPDFCLPNQFGEPVSLAALRGTAVALVFYPFAFSATCTAELGELRDNRERFAAAGVRLLAVSADSKYALRSYAAAENLGFELLSDFWPHGAVAQSYGVLDEGRGMALRSTFLIRAQGGIADVFSSPTGQARPLERYWQALEQL